MKLGMGTEETISTKTSKMSHLSISRTEKIALLPALFKPDFQLSYQKEKLRKFQRSFIDKSLLYQTSLNR